MKRFLILLIVFITGLFPFSAGAQQKLTLKESEDLFQKNNLHILASRFNVDMANAQVIQARLWENPYVFSELNAINPEANRYFDVGEKGQKVFAVQQLIYLGGKKKKEVELARSNARINQLEFEDLLRRLKYELRVTYFSIYYDRITISNLDNQLSHLDTLVGVYTRQAEKGNVPYKDIVRLQSLYLSLKNERISLQNKILEEEKKMKLLLGTNTSIEPNPASSETDICSLPLIMSLDTLQSLAIENRPDVLQAAGVVEQAEWNLKWQRSLAVPDLSLGVSYDQRGGAFANQVNMTLGIPLPLWNRNQGNIKLAEAYKKQSEVNQDLRKLEVQNEVAYAYDRYWEAYRNFQMIQERMDDNFEVVYRGVISNFNKRNISIIEFADFMESYTDSLIQLNEIRKSLREACEGINLVVMQNVFN